MTKRNSHKKRKSTGGVLLRGFIYLALIAGAVKAGDGYWSSLPGLEKIVNPLPLEQEAESAAPTAQTGGLTPEEVPEFSGEPYVELYNNVPAFDEEDFGQGPYEYYSPLDALGRCGAASARISKEMMPVEERGSIGHIRPSGWHTVKYEGIDGNYLYNRCHLIGYQLTGENSNEQNLITGTRYMNVTGMLPFENMVADYIEESGNQVLYRVTPIFENNDLVAKGVQMEAYSIEDNGKGLSFHVFVYNVQPGISIDYATGDSEKAS